ncbi:NAD(P)/FAD-dependent oxidoreductase [Lysobacter sp. CAU 1642]|uniref:NAD(P)/FAD-dependent oxidoreductase n=2 Tax=Pseudomarimonas salicorniae TaxID=2933270 RepID=A0ABT0GHS8_9GAMM|nr:NAD(P)/FAD-dependent oxidoreductase [Lysobacter sp. CAU 1642]
MCAAAAGQRGRSVVVLDHANKVGKKILMSGGGRCNFTNLFATPANYLSGNPHFCKSALSRYTQHDFIALVEKHGVPYHEKTLGQLFCDRKSRDILDLLLAECADVGAEVWTDCAVQRIRRHDAGFDLHTALGDYRCPSLVIATGGLSIPRMGATGFGYQVAKQFGLKLTPREAALVPFTLKGRLLSLAQGLAGVALPVIAECRGQRFPEALLFTHKGLSGPAILQVSNYWHPGDPVQIDFLPGQDLAALISEWRADGSRAELSTRLSRLMPKGFVQAWLSHHGLESALAGKHLADLSQADVSRLCDAFQRWTCVPDGTEGYATAEVTRGGVDTAEVSSKTFEARSVPGLYFIGEVLDVTGWLGGYNFQWAWASGWCAGQYV